MTDRRVQQNEMYLNELSSLCAHDGNVRCSSCNSKHAQAWVESGNDNNNNHHHHHQQQQQEQQQKRKGI